MNHIDGGGAAYHLPAAVRMQGILNRPALRQTLDELIRRHEVLRTHFAIADGEPLQRIADEATFALLEFDLRNRPEPGREEELRRIAMDEALAPFDLGRGPLIRGRLVRLADDKHVLLVTMHHIVADGWSLGIAIREIAQLYSAFIEGKPNPLQPLSVQYADYAQWQHAWLNGEALREQLEFWKQQLAGAPEVLALPTDRPRPVVQSYRGTTVPFALGAQLTRDLRHLARRLNATMYMVLASGFLLLLSRLSGLKDFVIGTPVANRQRTEVEGLIGFFANMIPLRARLHEDMDVEDLIAHVKSITLGAFDRQDVPFEQVVEAIRPQRTLSHNPVVQVVFALQNAPQGELTLPGLTLQPQSVPQTTAKFDLTLTVEETSDGIAGSFIYASDLFDRSTIERWGEYLIALFTRIAENPARGLTAISIGDEAVVAPAQASSPAVRAHDADDLIHRLFERQVAVRSGATALVCEAERLTFAELNERANRLARYLRSYGAGPDVRVAVWADRSADMVVAILGVLKAGAAYVPLEPAQPRPRLEGIVRHTAQMIVASRAAIRSEVNDPSVPIIAMDEAQALIDAQDCGNLGPAMIGSTAKDLAYVIHTSGSSGEPKGVMVEHGSVVNLWRALECEIYSEHPQVERVGVNASIAFDASVKQLIQLLSGRTLVVIPQAIRLDPVVLTRFIKDQQLHAVDCTPSQLRALLDAGLLQEPASQLAAVLVGGEAIESSLWQGLSRSPIAFYNVYGPTECTVDATIARIRDDSTTPHIGRAVLNARVYILDEQMRPVALGVVGEIYVAGAGVARGYLNRDALTNERFLPDPFTADGGARMYRTGDLGRWRADGNVEYVGRNDDQVKLRGFRVELGEIECQLRRHAAVREAVVVPRAEGTGDCRLVAYVTTRGEPGVRGEELRTYLSSVLPDYMVPFGYVVLESLPLSVNGKVDRKALPAPQWSEVTAASHESPEGATEEALAEIWKELLQIDRVGRHDSFFDLGGHSLLAIQVVVRVQEVLERTLDLRDLFELRTISALAAQLDRAQPTSAAPIERADRTQRLPLSWSQQRLWFIDQLQGAGAAYHIAGAVRLRGALHVSSLRRALDTLVERHEALRTTFVMEDGEPIQLIGNPCGFALQEIDLACGSSAHTDEHFRLHMAEETAARFDLSRGPLIRGRLLKLAEREHVLLVTMHHIVSDGWSVTLLISEVAALYEAYRHGAANPLEPLRIQYADYAAWQRHWLTAERLERELQYWKDELSQSPALLELPTDRTRPKLQSHRGDSVGLVLDAALTERLNTLARRIDGTLHMVLSAAFAVLLRRLSGQKDLVIGVPAANRPRKEVEGLIGFFVNTLAVRTKVDDQATVEQLLEYMRGKLLAAYSHQEIPFEQVVEAVRPQRSFRHSPVFQVMLSLQNTPQAAVTLSELELAPEPLQESTAKFDLTLSLREAEGRIVGGMNYATDLFDRATIERWLCHFQTLLQDMVEDPQQQVASLRLLSGAECDRLTQGFNQTKWEGRPNWGDSLHGGFFQRATSEPSRTALEFGARSMTYGELLERSRSAAQALLDASLCCSDKVGVMAPRGWQQVVGVFGALFAGGVYVPIDPSWPKERRDELIRQCAIRHVVMLREQEADLDLAPEIRRTFIEEHYEKATRDIGITRGGADLAYVIFTSGSTGQPKGVMIDHSSAVNTLWHVNRLFEVSERDKVLAVSELAFDLSVYDIFGVLGAGGTVVLPALKRARDPQHWSDLVKRHGITVWNSVPQLMGMLVEHQELGERADFPTLRLVLLSGDWIPVSLPDRIRRCAPQSEVISLGGATEGSVWSIYFPIGDVQPSWESIPYGSALPNQRMYVLDEQRRVAPIGVKGEIYIAGSGVACGYLNQEQLTAERFVPDPYSADGGGRMYRTGDLGRWRPDGTMEYLGRNDDQVKVRGFRIELGEIESQLRRHDRVKDAVVVAREDRPGDKRLVAYVTLEEPAPGSEQLRTYLRETLPDYMIPACMRLDALPLTVNGKVDRKALPAFEWTSLAGQEYEPPQGEIEQALAEIWKELLQLPRIGRHDSFFDLGGHSLLAVRMLARVRERLHRELALRDLFEFPTLHIMAGAIADASWRRSHRSCVMLKDGRRPLFLLHEDTNGDVIYYLSLTRHLDPGTAVFGLQFDEMRNKIAPARSVAELCTQHLEAIREIQPHGPYRLAGWSFGGQLAYEIACQLVAAGEQVEFLGLFDAPAPRDEAASLVAAARADAEVALVKELVARVNPALDASEFLRLEALDKLDAILSECKRLRYLPVEVQELEVEELRRRVQVGASIRRIAKTFSPRPLSVPSYLFRADAVSGEDPAKGWRGILGASLQVIEIGGTHWSMIFDDAYIARLGRALSGALLACERAAPVEGAPA